jgi:hypothetical protein
VLSINQPPRARAWAWAWLGWRWMDGDDDEILNNPYRRGKKESVLFCIIPLFLFLVRVFPCLSSDTGNSAIYPTAAGRRRTTTRTDSHELPHPVYSLPRLFQPSEPSPGLETRTFPIQRQGCRIWEHAESHHSIHQSITSYCPVACLLDCFALLF